MSTLSVFHSNVDRKTVNSADVFLKAGFFAADLFTSVPVAG